MTKPPVSEIETLPCGCQHWVSGDNFYYVPCKPSCKYYKYAVEQTREQGKPLIYRSAR